jgi:hypothetical protein|tara:strand:- start:1921 stop:2337 length:417 start_codon:yes stop_codon:yes gene_type:complete
MAITQAMCTSFKSEVLQEGHQLATDTIKIALYTSSASLDATTTAYSSSNEVSGTGYTATGVTLTSTAVSTTGTTAHFDADDPTWTSASFTARGALIYNSSNSNKAIAVLNFGGDFTVAGGTFKIVFPAAGSTAIIRID